MRHEEVEDIVQEGGERGSVRRRNDSLAGRKRRSMDGVSFHVRNVVIDYPKPPPSTEPSLHPRPPGFRFGVYNERP